MKSVYWVVRSGLCVIRQGIYVWRKIEVFLYNQCDNGRAMSIRYSECLFVALSIHHDVICCLHDRIIIFHLISRTARFSRKKRHWIENIYFYFLNRFVLKTSRSKKYLESEIKYVYWSSCNIRVILVTLQWNWNFFPHIFKKIIQIPKFYENMTVETELYCPVEMWLQKLTQGRGSEGETGEWSG